MTDELFPTTHSVSPARRLFLDWKEKHGVAIQEYHPLAQCEGPEECRSCDNPWVASIKVGQHNGPSETQIYYAHYYGPTQEEAATVLCRETGLPHWLQERAKEGL